MDDSLSKSNSGDDASPLKQQMLKRNSLFGDELLNFDPAELEDDDWRDVFDDPSSEDSIITEQASSGPLGESTRARSTATSSSTNDKTPAQPALSTGTKSSGAAPDSKSRTSFEAQNGEDIFSSRQPETSGVSDEEDQDEDERASSPTIAWQNPEVDKPFREKMMQDIAHLLFTRKKEMTPDEKWVAKVKAKARAFESQLYKNASSLEDYTDVTTLMRRIARLADAFAHHFRQAKRSSKRSSGSSVASLSSLGSLGDHFSSVELRRMSGRSLSSDSEVVTGLHKESNMSLTSSSPIIPGQLMNNVTSRVQVDSFIPINGNNPDHTRRASSAGGSMSLSTIGGNMNNLMGSNLGSMGMQQQQPQNNQLQQQLLANIQQQQQRLLAQQLNMGGGQMTQGNNSMMATQAAMMGNNGMVMLNQIQQRQQQQQQTQANSMNLNMMQQHSLLRQQQQNTMGMNMMQQNPNAATLMGNNASLMGNNGMTMMNTNMNMNMQSVIPGPTNGGGIGNMPGMNLVNNSNMGSRDTITMPPPGMLNVAAGVGQMQPGSNDELHSMSPDRFVGNDFQWWSGS